jgi:hypothetical protein
VAGVPQGGRTQGGAQGVMTKGFFTSHLKNKRYYPGWARTVFHVPMYRIRFCGRWASN